MVLGDLLDLLLVRYKFPKVYHSTGYSNIYNLTGPFSLRLKSQFDMLAMMVFYLYQLFKIL